MLERERQDVGDRLGVRRQTDPYFDLGDFCVEHPLSEDEERFIITRYCGAFDETAYARMMLHKIVADLWWSIWAMIQVRLSKLDFDFYEYGMNRVRRLHENAANPAFRVVARRRSRRKWSSA